MCVCRCVVVATIQAARNIAEGLRRKDILNQIYTNPEYADYQFVVVVVVVVVVVIVVVKLLS